MHKPSSSNHFFNSRVYTVTKVITEHNNHRGLLKKRSLDLLNPEWAVDWLGLVTEVGQHTEQIIRLAVVTKRENEVFMLKLTALVPLDIFLRIASVFLTLTGTEYGRSCFRRNVTSSLASKVFQSILQ